jgi:Ca-activated chloride channel family protein
VEAADLDTPRGWIEKQDDGAATVAVAFAPSFKETSTPAEIIFVVDRSGSMEGQSIAEVRNALQLCLRSMRPGCAFNIVGFGDTFQALFNGSRAYDEKSLAEASEHVTGLEADLGGTEILPALTHVLEQKRHPTLPRQVVILTDGEVTNTDAVLALAAKHAASARIFTFGIGASASHHLVKGLARAGGGVAEFIYPGERIEAKVVRQFGRLLSPALTDVRVDWHGADVTQAPSTVPPVFANGRLLIYGFLKQRRTDTVRAQLSANAPSGPISFDVVIDAAAARPGRVAGPLAARARIRELEESPAWISMRGSQQSHRKTSAVTREIIELSLRYGVISRETSFVAVERRETPVEGEVQLRRVPVALAAGWGGTDQLRTGFVTASLSAPAMRAAGPSVWAAATMKNRVLDTSTPFRLQDDASDTFEDAADFQAAESTYYAPEPAQEAFVEDPLREQMMALIMLQRADGSWDVSNHLERIVGYDRVKRGLDVVDAIPPLRGKHNVLATLIALAWFDRHAGHLHGEWEFVAAKGRQWLGQVFTDPSVVDRWVSEAATFL